MKQIRPEPVWPVPYRGRRPPLRSYHSPVPPARPSAHPAWSHCRPYPISARHNRPSDFLPILRNVPPAPRAPRCGPLPPPHISPPGLPLLPRPHKSPAPVRFFYSLLSSSSSLISYAHAIYSPALLFESPDVPLNQRTPFAQHGLQRVHIGFVHARARTGTLGGGTARRLAQPHHRGLHPHRG